MRHRELRAEVERLAAEVVRLSAEVEELKKPKTVQNPIPKPLTKHK
jgi:hypothetical protein